MLTVASLGGARPLRPASLIGCHAPRNVLIGQLRPNQRKLERYGAHSDSETLKRVAPCRTLYLPLPFGVSTAASPPTIIVDHYPGNMYIINYYVTDVCVFELRVNLR